MKRAAIYKSAIFLLLTLTVIGGVVFFTQDLGAPNASMDALERRLETSRHKQLLARITEKDSALNGFTTDGCSGGLSIFWKQFAARFPKLAARHGEQPPWHKCCVIHDRQYHVGSVETLSASESFEQRKKADLDLKACVVDTGERRAAALQDIYGLTESQVRDFYEAISELVYRAVRVGGIPCTNLPWRWGYGWPQCRKESNS